jgi:DNA-binding NarL/FixJ family response regulator
MSTRGNGEISIVVADDHTLFRDGLCEVLLAESSFRVVGEAANGLEAVELARRHQPDIVLLDMEMPGPGGITAIRSIGAASPRTRVIVLTMYDEPSLVSRALMAGAVAFLVKSIARADLVTAIHGAMRRPNDVVLSVSRETMGDLDRPTADNPLSARELEVLRLVAQAFSNAQIASRLYISEGTVKRHLTNIYGKLGATSRVDAVNRAVESRLIGPAPKRT